MALSADPFALLKLAQRAFPGGTPPPQVTAEAVVRAREEAEIARAREDVNVFMRLVFRNDQDEHLAPFEQQPFHREWQDLWETAQVSVMHGATGFGKTEQLIGRQVWKLGRNPSRRIMLVGKKEANASKLLQKIKRLIEESAMVRRIFPHLTPGEPWSTTQLRLSSAGPDITTHNVEVYGVEGSPQGVRGDEIILDDVIDDENTSTDEQRKKVIKFVDSVVQSRLTTIGQVHILANAWHKEDLAFTYAKRPGITYRCYPAIHPVTGDLLWPSFRPREWLEKKRGTMSHREFARMFLCQVADAEAKRFEAEWFAIARAKGAGTKPLRAVRHVLDREGHLLDPAALDNLSALLSQEMRIIVALDLATKEKLKKRKSDRTIFWVVGLLPSTDRQVLWAEGGRWTAPVILEKMAEYEQRYRPNRFVVESNAAQVYLAQFAQHFGNFEASIDEFITSGLKWDEALGIEEIGVEMKAGRWLLPGPAAGEHPDHYLARLTPEERDAYATIQAGCAHLEEFNRIGHTPDEVMAWYLAKEGVKRALTGVFSHRNMKTAEQQQREQAGAAGTAHALGLAPPPADPFVPDYVRHLLGQ